MAKKRSGPWPPATATASPIPRRFRALGEDENVVDDDREHGQPSQRVEEREARVAGRRRDRGRGRGRARAGTGCRRRHAARTFKARSSVAEVQGARAARIHSPARCDGTRQIDPYANDPGRWAHSLQQPRGDPAALPRRSRRRGPSSKSAPTRATSPGVLVEWAAGSGARVVAIDPSPQERLVRLAEERAELELVRETSLAALPHARARRRGDHRRRPQLLHGQRGAAADRRRPVAELPLLIFHDVGWPHGRRDDYYAPDADPGRAPPADPRGRRAAPGRAGDPLRRAALPRRGGARGRPWQRRADRRRGLRRRARGAAAGDRARLLRPRRRLEHRRAVGRRDRRAAGAVGPQPDAGAARGQPRLPSRRGARPDSCTPRLPAAPRRARRPCCGGCWTRARSHSPSGCRACATAPASRPSSRSCPRTRSGGRSSPRYRGHPAARRARCGATGSPGAAAA